MSAANVLLSVAVLIALASFSATAIVLRGDFTLRARLAILFLALALVPALLGMGIVWRELQPQTWRNATRGLGVSLESALILARNVLAAHQVEASDAAATALQRLLRAGAAPRADLANLMRTPYTAYLCRGSPGLEDIVASHGAWPAEAATDFVRDLLPGRRHEATRAQLVTGPDSSRVVVGVAGPAHFAADRTDAPLWALVAVPIPEAEAAAIEAVVETYQRSQLLRLLEDLHLRHTGGFLAALAVFIVVLAVTLGVLLARTLTRPIEQLRVAFERTAAGERGVQVDEVPVGELGRLTGAFNQMSRDLSRSQQELVQATRLAAWQEVARRLAHEIKNPLTPITLSIHRLRKRTGGNDKLAHECFDTILEETSHLERLANEFSSFARLPKPELRPVDANAVLQQVLELYAAHPGLSIRPPPGAVPEVLADRDQLRQVFTNVLKNAVEAMSGRGTLEVQASASADRVTFTFLDTGSGFGEGKDRVFEPAFTTKPTGSGLGLAIVRRILEDHGGEIDLGNRQGGGAWVRIGLRRAPSLT